MTTDVTPTHYHSDDPPERLPIVRRLLVVLTDIALTSALLIGVPSLASARPPTYTAPLVPKPTVVTGFDEPDQRWHAGHRGVDLAVADGAQVLAAGDGVVRFAGEVGGKSTVSIQHPDGLITTYEPVRPTVRRGDRVSRGTAIGTALAGHPGCPATACVHWGARRGAGRTADYVDPLGLLGAVRVRLKPLDG
ncbi:peptidase M23 [Gordonia sp. 852002-50816_SCH5313054-c]|uniref:M23 family metallopeptidase n=1 Tax=unclassified Gordonia (in: high G+C Gram-positive bacteria) TaxID=2657482 RepID=UPI0007EA382A|nr:MULTISPECIES: M23 family metallopeptidase [unclassified Gordonia (in: high G+C Gram-positive bacteria)]OBC12822.1 peptidase M23 [Gordonia sp. 852002-50816_SCH5313054-a]OBC19117.1 peptidase M23 [Gordonia sp. 852002-50816_SCH5313054-c]